MSGLTDRRVDSPRCWRQWEELCPSISLESTEMHRQRTCFRGDSIAMTSVASPYLADSAVLVNACPRFASSSQWHVASVCNGVQGPCFATTIMLAVRTDRRSDLKDNWGTAARSDRSFELSSSLHSRSRFQSSPSLLGAFLNRTSTTAQRRASTGRAFQVR